MEILNVMMLDQTAILILAVLFLATLIRSALGFGESLVAVPLLALVMPVEIVVPLAVLVSITIAVVIVAQDWRHVHFRSASWLVLFTFLGIPLGLLMLVTVAEAWVKSILAVVIIAFALYCLVRRSPVKLTHDRFAWFFGFGAGVLGGAYGMNGPPLVVYGTLRRWSPAHFRATLQAYFLPAGLVGMAGYWAAGLWVPTVTHYYLLSLLPVLAAILLGRMLNQRIDKRRFRTSVHVALIAIGVLLLMQVAWVSR